MNYDEALKRWGASKLSRYDVDEEGIDWETITVSCDFNEGFACCGGSDPGCYCSFAESPSAYIRVTGVTKFGRRSYEIEFEDFDFSDFLHELLDVSEVISK